MQAGVLLVVIAQVYIAAEVHRAVVGGQLSGDDVQEGGLAYAVGADDGHPISRAQVQAEVFEQRAPFEAL